MKKKFLLGFAVLLTVFVVTLSAGCIDGLSDPIVGSWEDSEGLKIVEFKFDGTGEITYADGITYPLTWSKVSGSENLYDVVVTISESDSQSGFIKLSGDLLFNANSEIWGVKASSDDTSLKDSLSKAEPVLGKWIITDKNLLKEELIFMSDGSGKRLIYTPNAGVLKPLFEWEKVSGTENQYIFDNMWTTNTIKLDDGILYRISDPNAREQYTYTYTRVIFE